MSYVTKDHRRERRNLLKAMGLSAIVGGVGVGLITDGIDTNNKVKKKNIMSNKTRKRVVIIGGGISGLSIASGIRDLDIDKEIEIVVLEKGNKFHCCPGSNILLSKTEKEYVEDLGGPAEWLFSYQALQSKFIKDGDILKTNCEVVGGSSLTKRLETNCGYIDYDSLILATGIEYDYEAQFPYWTSEKIEKAKILTPSAMHQDGGEEWFNMKNRFEKLLVKAKSNKDKIFNIVINPTPKTDTENNKTLRRCPPAAGERATMLASRIKKEELNNVKIHFLIELDSSLGSKSDAFEDSWEKLGYCKDINNPTLNDIIIPIFNSRIFDIDFDEKTIKYHKNILNDDLEVESIEGNSLKYDEAIIMPYQKTPKVIENIFCKNIESLLVEDGFEIKIAKNHYILGDSQTTHPLPASGSMALNISSILCKKVYLQVLNKKEEKLDFTQATNVCFSFVGENPDEAIKVEHNIFSNDGVLKGKGKVSFKTNDIALEQAGWLHSISVLFKV